MIRRFSRRGFVAAGPGASAAAFARGETRPGTNLYNGRILSMGSREREVEALAVAARVLSGIGSSNDMLALAGPTTRRIDLGRPWSAAPISPRCPRA